MYTFIVNPHSRSGLGGALWSVVEKELKRREILYSVFLTRYQKHAAAYARALTADGHKHTIVVLGGDGTINEVINGICDFSKITLGYIPTGSGNDFARSFGIPAEPLKALDLILAPSRFAYMDIGILSCHGKQRRFAVSAGFGFDAAICHEAVVSRVKPLLNKLRLGKFSYALIALHRLLLTAPSSMTVTLDGGQPMSFQKVWFAAVMNHPYEGGGLRFCPDAVPDDGLLDMIIVSGMGALRLLCVLPFAFAGRHTRFKGVRTYRCRQADIVSVHSLPVHTDGEPVFPQRHLHIAAGKTRLKVITG